MKFIVISISIIVLLSCNKGIKGFHLLNSREEIKSYKSNDLFYKISRKWYVNDSILYYYFDESVFNLLKENKKQFESLTKSEIIELFGKPNIEENSKYINESFIEYYMNTESNYTRIHSIRFIILNNKVYNIDIGKRYIYIE